MKELGAKEIEIKCLGERTFKEAVADCISCEEIKNPFDPIKEAKLLKGLIEQYKMTAEEMDLSLPYNSDEIKNKLNLLEFNWDELNLQEEEEKKKEKKLICPNCGYEF